MKIKLSMAVLAALVMTGCNSTPDTTTAAVAEKNSVLAKCDLPTVEGDRGPIRHSMYVIGTFPEGQWMHMEHRKMSYKGDGIYQAIIDEKAATVDMQFATIGWKPQYTVSGRNITVGQEIELKKGGFMKDSKVKLEQDGKYVWAIQVKEDRSPVRAVVSKCE